MIRNGGGINNRDEAPVTISNSTFYDNDAAFGSSIFNTGLMTVKNTLAAGVVAHSHCHNALSITYETGETVIYEGTFVALGTNLGSDESCPGFVQVDDPADRILGPLSDNGGSTPTHALLPGSPVLDMAADCTTVDGMPLINDQRGAVRPEGTACDVGAYEAEITG